MLLAPLNSALSYLRKSGWCLIRPGAVAEPSDFLVTLGSLLPSRGTNYRDLRPYHEESAPVGSMSSIIGTARQPMHTDGAWCAVPPNYLVFQCIDPGEAPCPTHIWAADLSRLVADRPTILSRTNWVAFGAGGNTGFYCSVMEVHADDVRLRFDPCCMKPAENAGYDVGGVVRVIESYCSHHTVFWERQAVLIINNWHCLHARGFGADNAPSRTLRRWSIGADSGLVI